MAQLLQAPTEGYEDAIVIPEINANFELKHGLINLVQNKQFFGHDKEDLYHAHIRYFNKITSTMRFPDIPSTSIKLMLFSFSLVGSARIWIEKEPPRSIFTWDDLVSKFINQFFPTSKTKKIFITKSRDFNKDLYEAWDRFNDLLRACPHHGFSELHQLDTFYNDLNANDQDSLNSAASGNFLDKMPLIESKSKVRNLRNKAVVAKVSSNSSTPGISPDIAALTTEVSELKNMMKTMLIDKQKAQAPAPVKATTSWCKTVSAHSYKNCPATDGNVYRDNILEYVSQAAAANFNQGNTNARPPMVSNQIRPPGFPPIQNNQNRFNQNQGNNFNQNRGTNFNQNRGSNFNQGQVYQPPTIQTPVYQAPTQQMQGTLPSQTVTNPREHVNAITTRSGKTCEGPSTPLVPTSVVSTPLKEPEQNPETSMDKVQKPSSESTAQVPPPEDHDSIFIEIPKPKAKNINKQFAHAISVIDFSKDEPFSGSTTNHSDALPPSSSPVKTSDNIEEFADELTLLKKGVHEENFQVYSNPLFEFDDNFTSSNENPLFNELDEDISLLVTENVHANPSSIIESLPVSLIPVEDSDPVQEEIHIFLVLDDLIPPGVENDDSEDEDNSTFLPDHELPNLDHQDNPSAPRPPPEPPDVKISLELDTTVINNFDVSKTKRLG
ncbi:reverse transcriptase domain-containing protein [Tanacetum coccineum]